MKNNTIPEQVLSLAAAIQQIPAPTFMEQARAEFVSRRFQEEGIKDPHIDQMGNVYACVPGKPSELTRAHPQPIVVSAHLDTVFPEHTDLSLQRTQERLAGPGIGDNSLGVAGLFGLLWQLRLKPLERDIWLVANVGEEGLGNLRGMQAVVDRFADHPKAYIVLEGTALGVVYHRGLAVQRYSITAHTAGGHSWVNFGQPSAIHELARFIIRLEDLPVSRGGSPGVPRSSYNVGLIHGGSSVNTIAAQAWLELDLRSEDEQHLQTVVQQVEALIGQSSRTGERAVTFSLQSIGSRPAGCIAVDHPLVQAAQAAVTRQGITPRLDIGSTDANLPLSCGYPAICIGLTRGGGAHSLSEYIEIAPLVHGLAQLEMLVRAVDEFS